MTRMHGESTAQAINKRILGLISRVEGGFIQNPSDRCNRHGRASRSGQNPPCFSFSLPEIVSVNLFGRYWGAQPHCHDGRRPCGSDWLRAKPSFPTQQSQHDRR